MSGLVKGVKKVFKKTGALVGAATSKVVGVAKKIVKSKVFKIALVAATAYFGGAALMAMAGGGTASAGIGSAWAGIKGAGSALMAGNFSGAASAIGSGFTGGAAAGATGTFAAGQAATQSAITAGAKAATAVPGAVAGTQTAIQASTPQLAAMHGGGAAATMTPAVAAPTAASSSGGLLSSVWGGLGEAGKGAVISSGINMAGQMIQGHAAEKAAEEERENRNYFGVDGKGNAANLPSPGLLNPSTFQPATLGFNYTPTVPKTLDELIARQQQTVNNYPKWS
jgi:hypothetical protein